MKTVNACKLNCPQPIILTIKALEENDSVVTIVDNDIAKQNVIKLCNKENYSYKVEEKESNFYIEINKGKENQAQEADKKGVQNSSESDRIYLITSDKFGKGSDDLGKILIKGFIYTLSQTKPSPKNVIFINSGVKLACENSESIDDLKELSKLGTKIVACGTCLDFFNLKDKLLIGEISNMYDIVELITNSKNVVTI